jgi:hypothetical protein
MKKATRIFLIIVAIAIFFVMMMVTVYHQTEGVRSEKYIHR